MAFPTSILVVTDIESCRGVRKLPLPCSLCVLLRVFVGMCVLPRVSLLGKILSKAGRK